MTVLLSKINYNRRREFLVRTNIVLNKSNIFVEKQALGNRAWEMLSNTESFYLKLSKNTLKGIRLSKYLIKDIKNKCVRFEFIKGETIRSKIERALIERDFKSAEEFYKLSNNLIDSFTTKISKGDLQKFISFINDYKIIPNGIYKQFVFLTELSSDHMIISEKGGVPVLIDYENFLGLPLPTRYIKFRAEIYLLLALQQIIRSLGSKHFVLTTYWKDLYIPQEWKKINNFTLEEKKLFLHIEKKLQNYLYNIESNIETLNLLNYQEGETMDRASSKLTVQSLLHMQQANDHLNVLQNSKIYKIWRLYHKIRGNKYSP